MNNITLEVFNNGTAIFHSEKHWLLPLFDLEAAIAEYHLDISNAKIHDKVIGKAAALLILRLGAGSVHADVISELACAVFERVSFPYSFITLVNRIDCQTEKILSEIDDPVIAYQILYERIHV